MDLLRKVSDSLLDFIFPQTENVRVLETLSPAEFFNKLTLAAAAENEHTIVLFNYADPLVREMIWELKYKGNARIGHKLAEILYDVLRQDLAERALFENFKDPLLVPMPISDKRRRERGWNQTEILSEALKRLDRENLFTYSPNLLIKHKHTESQARTHATKREREANLEHSIRVRDPELMRSKSIILLDDVTTSGATFNEARRALKAAGIKKILCVALAH